MSINSPTQRRWRGRGTHELSNSMARRRKKNGIKHGKSREQTSGRRARRKCAGDEEAGLTESGDRKWNQNTRRRCPEKEMEKEKMRGCADGEMEGERMGFRSQIESAAASTSRSLNHRLAIGFVLRPVGHLALPSGQTQITRTSSSSRQQVHKTLRGRSTGARKTRSEVLSESARIHLNALRWRAGVECLLGAVVSQPASGAPVDGLFQADGAQSGPRSARRFRLTRARHLGALLAVVERRLQMLRVVDHRQPDR